MNSVEKVYLALEELEDMDDHEIKEALPIPISVPAARGIIPMVARAVPENAHDLDEFLTQVGNFCHSLRSDGYEPAPAA